MVKTRRRSGGRRRMRGGLASIPWKETSPSGGRRRSRRTKRRTRRRAGGFNAGPNGLSSTIMDML